MSFSRCPRRRSSLALLLILTVSVAGSCKQALETQVSADSQAKPEDAPRRAAKASMSLDFDLPDEFWTKDADGREVVTGFRVGYFQPGDAAPIATIEIARDAIVIKGRTGRVSLDPERVPKDAKQLVIRLQTVTRNASSQWSDPSPPVPAAGTAPARVPANKAARKPRVSMSDIERYPRLAEAMAKTLSPAVKPEQVLESYRSLNELATAVVICRDHGIPLEKLSQSIAGPPRRSLRIALREIKPELRGGGALQKAKTDSRHLLEQGTPKP